MQLLDIKSGEVVVQLFQKTMSKDAWPALQLTPDESLVAHMVNNTVNIYSTKEFSKGVTVRKLLLCISVLCSEMQLNHQWHAFPSFVTCDGSCFKIMSISAGKNNISYMQVMITKQR